MTKITLTQLEHINACTGAKKRFYTLFGTEAEVTEANIRRYLGDPPQGISDIEFLCRALTEGAERHEFCLAADEAWVKFTDATDPTYDVLQELPPGSPEYDEARRLYRQLLATEHRIYTDTIITLALVALATVPEPED